ncbi:MAG TPA: hypothetical protein VHV31_07720 [Nitrolancea sp.]|nr:hypothetical protein [Nitrolancea sp.]
MEPGVAAYRPLSVSDLIDETIRIFRNNFLLFCGIGAVLMIPAGLIMLIQQIAVQQHGSDLAFSLLTSFLVSLVRAIVYVGVLAATFHAFTEIRAGRKTSVIDSYNIGLEHFVAMLWTTFLVVFMLVLISITVIGIPAAIYLSISWLFALHATAFERKFGWSVLARSRALVKGEWLRVFGITILVGIIAGLANLVFSIPNIALGVAEALGSEGATFRAVAASISVIFSTAGWIVTGPIIYISSILLYFDLRARKEGYDLEMMANQAEADARSAAPQS